ncbi:MAG: FAD-dependent oxidoreductase [Chitinophagaceae bacterium]
MQKNITIIGAGLVGSLLSIFLSKRGYKIKTFERRSDMRKEKIIAGRSINLALSDRGLIALEKVRLADKIKQIAIPMHGRFIHNINGLTAFQPYGKQGQFINSVSRTELNKALINTAEQNGVEIFFNHKCKEIDWNRNEINFELQDASGEKRITNFQLLFGADGAYSSARLQHMLHHQKFNYNQFYINCGYKELNISAGKNNSFLIEKNALHIWPRKEFMLIALPNLDGSFTCTLFFPFEGELSFSKLNTEEKVKNFFEKNFADAIELMPNYVQEFLQNPVSSLVTVKCFPWIRENKFCLIGDAAHAIVPFFGQGMNCGFEDCTVLDNLIEKYADNWNKILNEFEALRKPDADAIADMALNNFTEMREKVADPKFLLQKKIEAKLHEKYADKWIPAYSLVTFSPHIRYSEALKNSEKQEKIMQQIMQLPDIENKWNDEEIEKIIIKKLEVFS